MSPPAVTKCPPSVPETRRQWAGFLPIVPLRPGRIACPHCDGTGFAAVSIACSVCKGRTTVPE